MTAISRSNAELDPRRRRAIYRSRHRGMREMDLILGAFADREVAGLTAAELAQYERLLDMQDADLLTFVTVAESEPPGEVAGIVGRIRTFCRFLRL